MKPSERANRPGLPRMSRPIAGILAILLVSPFATSGCSSSGAGATGPGAMTAMPASIDVAQPGAVPAAAMANDMAPDANEAWSSRPAFTRADPQIAEAYAYALFKPQIVKWMPCYCGCDRMEHRSNLDCYLKPAVSGRKTQFEEHASYCNVCVQITLLTKKLVAQGKSLSEIRQAVDQAFGGTGPGTPTALPPA